jgi:hypothetical protein
VSNLTLTGLSPRQRQWAEILWLTDDAEEVRTFCAQDRDARIVHDLIVAAELDQYMEISTDVKDYCRGL